MRLSAKLAGLMLWWAIPALGAGGPTIMPAEIETDDGVVLHGDYRPVAVADGSEADPAGAGEPAVVLLHMYRSTREAWTPILEPFQAAGIATLAIDMRGHGESTAGPDGADLAARAQARDPELFRAMWRDAAAAVAWLEKRGHDAGRIGLLGASVGCSVAFDAARRDDRLRVVGVLTPGTNYLGISTLDQLGDWGDRATLIVSSIEEAERGAKPIADALSKTQRAKVTYWELEESRVHGTNMFGKVWAIEIRTVNWFASKLGASRLEVPSQPEEPSE